MTSVSSLVFGVGTVLGVLSLSSIVDNKDVTGTIGVATGLLGGALTWLVYNAPFKLIRILNETVTSLREHNAQLEVVVENLNQSAVEHQSANTEQQHQNEFLKNEIIVLNDTNIELHLRITGLTKVEKGLKTTSENLLKLLVDSTGNNEQSVKINTALVAVADDISAATSEQGANLSQFMKQLLSMESLEQRLEGATEDNERLHLSLEVTVASLKKVTQSQEKLQFDDKLTDLARWIDHKADGESGIRAALKAGQGLGTNQNDDILDFFERLDQIIKLHDETLQISRECTRAL